MCMDPVSIALMAGSTLMNTMANRQVTKAQQSAYNAQAERNRGYQAQSDKVLNEEAMPNFTQQNQNQVLADAQLKRLSDSEALAGGGYDLPMTESASGDYKTELANAIASKVKEGRAQAEAATRIGAYGDLGLNNANLLTDTGLKIGTIGQNSRNDAAILPFELQAAQSKGAGLRTIGDLLGGAGMIYGMGNTGNGFSPVTAFRYGTDPFSQQSAMLAKQDIGIR